MRKFTLFIVLVIFIFPLFLHGFTYLSDSEYRALSSGERREYIAALEVEMSSMQRRRADAMASSMLLEMEIEETRGHLSEMNEEIAELMAILGITEETLAATRARLRYYQDQLTNWERMSDNELWRNARAFTELREDYYGTRQTREARLPEFQRDITELNRRFTAVGESVDRARRTSGYYEDSYTVQRGDSLSRIAGYDFIYNDSTRWPIIFRANRDQISNPNLIHPGQNLRIPRGQPTTWRVWRGESLWRIAQYPEVYGTGTRWPVIYRANQDQIRDPNLIFPDQILVIPRDGD
ncbi:MAG: LysM peptidoglycan-binding domain-containing protein [Candidatus Cloacimonetes bacterium]|nr:LysM peptidoglycan-binding domain-containing protein [Candidatus Cloacimonadota bacterium]